MNDPDHKAYPLICRQNPWSHNTNTIWLASTITLNRNIEKFN